MCSLAIQAPVLAADGPHAWVVPAPRLVKETYFSNLQDGAAIETPFLLKFGLTGLGLAPIVKPVAMTGHHHLLVNRELPLDFSKPLPFNDQYIHFGKGQMETVLTFPPGQYQLRLVLADDKHIPNFVYSKPVTVTVTKKNDNVDPKSLVTKGVAILIPHNGDKLAAPFRVAMHASGMNVSNTALREAGSGHFRLRVKPDNGREEVIALDNGFTEVWLKPPSGSYSARVEFVDNVGGSQVLASSEPVAFRVER
ncbi:MAG TPA: DUF4399 domain-containing protein [Burkholderiaceae bacterium]|nr:DUF4399 domain-containing protein [Burkholderiaceae bacterium]